MDPSKVVHEIKFIYPRKITWSDLLRLKLYATINEIKVPDSALVDVRYDYTKSVVTVSWEEPAYNKPFRPESYYKKEF